MVKLILVVCLSQRGVAVDTRDYSCYARSVQQTREASLIPSYQG